MKNKENATTTRYLERKKKNMGRKTEMSVEQAAKIMHKEAYYIRLGLQQGAFPFGSAVQKPNGRWSYNIIPAKFYEYMGISEEVCINENK